MARYIDDAAEGSGSEAAHEDDYASGDEDGADQTLGGFINDGDGSDSGSGSGGEEPCVRPRLPGDELSDGESAGDVVAALRQRHGRSRRVRPAGGSQEESGGGEGGAQPESDNGDMESDHSGDAGDAQPESDNGDMESDYSGDEEGDSRRATQDEDRMESDHSGDEEGGSRRAPRRRPRGVAVHSVHVDLTQPVQLVGAYDRYAKPCPCEAGVRGGTACCRGSAGAFLAYLCVA